VDGDISESGGRLDAAYEDLRELSGPARTPRLPLTRPRPPGSIAVMVPRLAHSAGHPACSPPAMSRLTPPVEPVVNAVFPFTRKCTASLLTIAS